LKSPKPYLALVAGLAASLAACATTTPRHAGAAALATAHSPGRSAHTRAGCPLGRLLPHGGAIAIDYVDFLRFGRRMYIASAEPIKASKLGRVITHVRCSLAAEDDQRHAEPPLINRTASFLAAGSAIYRSATTPRAADWRRTGTASYRSASPRPPCTITPRPRPAHPIERPTDTHGHEPPESLSDDRQLRRSLPHPNRNAHLAKLIFPAGVSSVAVSLLAGQDADNQDQFMLSGIASRRSVFHCPNSSIASVILIPVPGRTTDM